MNCQSIKRKKGSELRAILNLEAMIVELEMALNYSYLPEDLVENIKVQIKAIGQKLNHFRSKKKKLNKKTSDPKN